MESTQRKSIFEKVKKFFQNFFKELFNDILRLLPYLIFFTDF